MGCWCFRCVRYFRWGRSTNFLLFHKPNKHTWFLGLNYNCVKTYFLKMSIFQTLPQIHKIKWTLFPQKHLINNFYFLACWRCSRCFSWGGSTNFFPNTPKINQLLFLIKINLLYRYFSHKICHISKLAPKSRYKIELFSKKVYSY